MNNRKTTEDFTRRAIEKHGDKYDYSLSNYITWDIKVKIICPEHGEFEQLPLAHIAGGGCKKCNNIKIKERNSSNTEDFIKKCRNKHRDKYDYSLVNYTHVHKKVKIICPVHGVIEQTPQKHLNTQGCPLCDKSLKLDKESFVEKCNKIHDNKYDYSLTNYINSRTKIEIICKKHGKFEQLAGNHLKGIGCPLCNESKGETTISNILKINNINFNRQHTFDNCKKKIFLPFDFYLPELNTCIEYDGIQHFEIVNYFGGENAFNQIIENDKIKNEYCLKNNIRLIRIKYGQDIEEELFKLIQI
jgi:very-short-patch-repair endonuclease